jgi:putative redox protein
MMTTSTATRTAKPTTTTVHATWRSGQAFDVQGSAGAPIVIDGAKQAGSGPVDTLLGAFAACSAVDVIEYLEKRRTPARRCEVVVTAERRAEPPRRVLRARLEFRIDGEGIDATHAERAIAVSLERYCSVAASLARDLAVTTVLVLNGAAGAECARRIPDVR